MLILDRLGKYTTNQSAAFQDKLDETFRKHWGDYPADLFVKRQSFAKMTGVRLAEFLEIAHLVVDDIVKFKGRDIHKETKSFIGILELFQKIVAFTKQTIIEDGKEDEYKTKMKQFKTDVKKFYNLGRYILFNDGGNETMYAHCLRFYMPTYAKEVLELHNAPLGVFSMQGYEVR